MLVHAALGFETYTSFQRGRAYVAAGLSRGRSSRRMRGKPYQFLNRCPHSTAEALPGLADMPLPERGHRHLEADVALARGELGHDRLAIVDLAPELLELDLST